MRATLETLAYEMERNYQDFAPESTSLLPTNQLLVSYEDGCFVVDTLDTCNMTAWVKLYKVTPRAPRPAKHAAVEVAKAAVCAVLIVSAVPAFAWSHSGGNSESTYNHRHRS
jgi:hypothetical protein